MSNERIDLTQFEGIPDITKYLEWLGKNHCHYCGKVGSVSLGVTVYPLPEYRFCSEKCWGRWTGWRFVGTPQMINDGLG